MVVHKLPKLRNYHGGLLVFCNWSKIVVISHLTFVGDYGLKRGLSEAPLLLKAVIIS